MAPFEQKRMLAHVKHAGGRPTEYRPEYCDAVIEAMSRGLSLTAFAGTIRVARETVYKWMSVHREFSDAVSRAKPARVLSLETKLLTSRKGAETTAAIFALRNADPTEWRDVRNVQHDHAHSVQVLTDAQLNAIAAGQSAGDAGVIDASYEDITATR